MIVEFWIHAHNLKIFKAGGWVKVAQADHDAGVRTLCIRADVDEVETGEDDERKPVVHRTRK